jgi:DNA polymerase-3 subunit delta'
MIRESFIYNFGVPDIRRMDEMEQNFATRFAPYVNESNIINIADELAEAERHIVQNTNPKMVFFDLALKMIVLLIQK